MASSPSSPPPLPVVILRALIALVPWVAVLYLHYRLEHDALWSVDMPFRALISVVLLALGMLASFLLYGRLTRP